MTDAGDGTQVRDIFLEAKSVPKQNSGFKQLNRYKGNILSKAPVRLEPCPYFSICQKKFTSAGSKMKQAVRTAKPSYRKLILTSLDWGRPKDPPLSLGHASILSNAKIFNLDVVDHSWRVNSTAFNHKEFSEKILDSYNFTDCDLAMGVFVWNEQATVAILKNLKRASFKGRIILGGPT